MTQRPPRPKNAAPNTIFTSFDVDAEGHATVIRYSGEPIPVLKPGVVFHVPVAWGYLGSYADEPEINERDWFPTGSCKMSCKRRKAVPQSVRDAENLIGEDGLRHPDELARAYTVWFEYLLDEAKK